MTVTQQDASSPSGTAERLPADEFEDLFDIDLKFERNQWERSVPVAALTDNACDTGTCPTICHSCGRTQCHLRYTLCVM